MRVDTRKRIFSMNTGGKLVRVSENVYIQKWKDIVALLLERETNVLLSCL